VYNILINMKTINITIILVLFALRALSFNTLDSLGIQKVDGKNYIVHKVRSDETLYSLLRKYECSTGEVLSCNPELKNSTSIYVNQVIKFPTLLSIPEPGANSAIQAKEYTVKPGETLYSISRNYGIALEQLRNLNGLKDNNIKSGQTLILSKSENLIAKSGVLENSKKTFPPKAEKTGVTVVPNAPMGERVVESGLAQVINTGRKSNKHLALHRTAPVGSLMKITNEATGDKVIVKVIGPLPLTGENENILVRISPTAYNKLKPHDSSLRAEVVYTLPPRSR
jgi:LysM repeat protein